MGYTMRKDFLEYAEAQLARAEGVADKWRAVVRACKEVAATELVHPPADKPQTKRQRVDYLINQTIDLIPQDVTFNADTVFENFAEPGFDRNKTKVSISFRLSQMEKNGELQRVGWGMYKKS
jgi:hypothetical protein